MTHGLGPGTPDDMEATRNTPDEQNEPDEAPAPSPMEAAREQAEVDHAVRMAVMDAEIADMQEKIADLRSAGGNEGQSRPATQATSEPDEPWYSSSSSSDDSDYSSSSTSSGTVEPGPVLAGVLAGGDWLKSKIDGLVQSVIPPRRDELEDVWARAARDAQASTGRQLGVKSISDAYARFLANSVTTRTTSAYLPLGNHEDAVGAEEQPLNIVSGENIQRAAKDWLAMELSRSASEPLARKTLEQMRKAGEDGMPGEMDVLVAIYQDEIRRAIDKRTGKLSEEEAEALFDDLKKTAVQRWEARQRERAANKHNLSPDMLRQQQAEQAERRERDEAELRREQEELLQRNAEESQQAQDRAESAEREWVAAAEAAEQERAAAAEGVGNQR